ncbi:MAG: 50S ribosomal protein L1 [Gammaproteobacteria bacterium]|nr:50S ribosomal protein L1 [Gammaproteobacteria bacterium]MDE0252401.1 50S ribosomal protein L1 [Gammaproteobacteria bacterium]MDE0402490.1 50S ribosomal protein L1 [Gammaproteobacteria bacterium]
MAKLSKRRRIANEKIDNARRYPLEEAVEFLNELAKTSKFRESLDVAINLGIDPRRSDQIVRGATTLPHSIGKEIRVAVFADGDQAKAAEKAGADIVGLEDLAEQVKKGNLGFDVVLATPDSMKVLGPLGRILGPRGLMPNVKTGTVTNDMAVAVKNAKSGQVQFRADRGGVVHGCIGQVGQDPHIVKANVSALLEDLRRARPASSKGTYFKKITLSSTMGPGIMIEETSISS